MRLCCKQVGKTGGIQTVLALLAGIFESEGYGFYTLNRIAAHVLFQGDLVAAGLIEVRPLLNRDAQRTGFPLQSPNQFPA